MTTQLEPWAHPSLGLVGEEQEDDPEEDARETTSTSPGRAESIMAMRWRCDSRSSRLTTFPTALRSLRAASKRLSGAPASSIIACHFQWSSLLSQASDELYHALALRQQDVQADHLPHRAPVPVLNVQAAFMMSVPSILLGTTPRGPLCARQKSAVAGPGQVKAWAGNAHLQADIFIWH